MSLIGVDFETRSDVNLLLAGSMKYFHDKSADIVCMGYRNLDEHDKAQLWIPGTDVPDCISRPEGHTFFAHNAQFDWRAWNLIGIRYGFHATTFSQWIDTMAICGRFTYPQNLDKVGDVLDLGVKKNKRGKQLIAKICTPPYNYTHTELFEFYDYCRTDVDSMCHLLNALPASQLSQEEQKIWELTCKINFNGLPVDIEAVNQIYKLTEAYKTERLPLLGEVTDGAIYSVNQYKAIRTWLASQKVYVDNIQAGTVERLLERIDLPEKARQLLELRQELGKSSTAKFLRLIEQELNGKIYDNLRYYGTNTGRWSGMGFQLHNLPRSKVKDAQPIIDKFYDLSVIDDNPIDAAKSIIRGMIKAPDGYMLCFADYHAVENIGLAWCADDQKTLELFRRHMDQYIDMASFVYEIPYEDVTEDQRQFGKMLVLGCGYGLGPDGFRVNSENWGVYVENIDAKRLVHAYRKRYHKVVTFWYACKAAAMDAIVHPGVTFTVLKHKFTVIRDRNNTRWLQMTLRSGRHLYYESPTIGEGKFGAEVKHMGINPYSKKWSQLSIIPGRFVENIVQATTRDILAHGKMNLDDAGYHLIGSIHDEVILLVREGHDCLEDVYRIMCKTPTWATDFPLSAEGVIEKRYRKM